MPDYALAIPKSFKSLVLSVDDTEGEKEPWIVFLSLFDARLYASQV